MSIIATARNDGTGTVTLPTSGEQSVATGSLDDARDELLDLIAAEAAEVGHPLRVEAHDPDAIYHVVVHPDGQIEPEQPQAGTTTGQPQAPAGQRTLSVARAHRRRRIIAGTAITALSLGSLGGLAIALSRPAPAPVASAPALVDPDSAAASTPTPTPPATLDLINDRAVTWHGAVLPVDTTAGPRTWTPTRAAGFAHSPLGAALAAVHISTHIDPYTGPRTFRPTIRQQVLGNTALLDRVNTAYYRRMAADVGATSGQPLRSADGTGTFLSWRINDYDAAGTNQVRLLVQTAQGQTVEFTVPVRWNRGDWKAAPAIDTAGAHFQNSTTPPTDTAQFHPFHTLP